MYIIDLTKVDNDDILNVNVVDNENEQKLENVVDNMQSLMWSSVTGFCAMRTVPPLFERPLQDLSNGM